MSHALVKHYLGILFVPMYYYVSPERVTITTLGEQTQQRAPPTETQTLFGENLKENKFQLIDKWSLTALKFLSNDHLEPKMEPRQKKQTTKNNRENKPKCVWWSSGAVKIPNCTTVVTCQSQAEERRRHNKAWRGSQEAATHTTINRPASEEEHRGSETSQPISSESIRAPRFHPHSNMASSKWEKR